MWRSVMHLVFIVLRVRDLRKYPSLTRREKDIKFKLLASGGLAMDSSYKAEVAELFDIRFKKRIDYLEVFHSLVRMTMLYESLELIG